MTSLPSHPLIVMPAYNEEETVGQTIAAVKDAVPDIEVLVVNDGSTDSTAHAARQAGAQVLSLDFNLGVGAAMRLGFRFARENGHDAVIQIDADGQHDPKYVPAMLRALAENDVVVGSRFAGEGDYRVSFMRKVAFTVLSWSLTRHLGTQLTDTSSGYRGASARAISVYARHYPAEYLGDTVESLVMAPYAGLRVQQIPVAMRQRQGGRPSQSLISSLAYFGRAIFVLALARSRDWSYVQSVTPAVGSTGGTVPAPRERGTTREESRHQ